MVSDCFSSTEFSNPEFSNLAAAHGELALAAAADAVRRDAGARPQARSLAYMSDK